MKKLLLMAVCALFMTTASFAQSSKTTTTQVATQKSAKMWYCPKCNAASQNHGYCPNCHVKYVQEGDYYCPNCYMSHYKMTAGKCPKCQVDLVLMTKKS
jgi:uncharacterized paraquat-inducible protein A